MRRATGGSVESPKAVLVEALVNGIPVRDRLMHPKKALDLVVTDDEVNGVMKAYKWILAETVSLTESMLERQSQAARQG